MLRIKDEVKCAVIELEIRDTHRCDGTHDRRRSPGIHERRRAPNGGNPHQPHEATRVANDHLGQAVEPPSSGEAIVYDSAHHRSKNESAKDDLPHETRQRTRREHEKMAPLALPDAPRARSIETEGKKRHVVNAE